MPERRQGDALIPKKAATHLSALFREATIRSGKEDCFKAFHNLHHAYRQELSEHLARALKAYLSTQQPTSYEEMKALTIQLNTLLRDFGLAFSYENKPCLLRAQSDGDMTRLRLQVQDSPQSRPRSFTSLAEFLPFLVLTEEAPRKVSHQGMIERL
jgi:hypothetical protein